MFTIVEQMNKMYTYVLDIHELSSYLRYALSTSEITVMEFPLNKSYNNFRDDNQESIINNKFVNFNI